MSSLAPKMAIRHQKPQKSSAVEVQLKLTRLVRRHEKVKISYHRLKDQVNDGLLQAEEVFASLAIPLMKLVGLKTVEMAEEGRFTTIVTAFTRESQTNGIVTESPVVGGGDRNDQNGSVEGENCVTRAVVIGSELIEKQRTQLLQLVQILRKIETHVNSSQEDLLQTIDNHNVSLHKFFQKAICYISVLQNQNRDALLVTLKLLQVIFNNVRTVLGSVKDGVQDLIQDLSEQMCNPMVEYVKRLKDEIKDGKCVGLLAMVEEMGRMMKDGRHELEDAREKVRVAEEGRIEALCKLEATKERVRKMKDHLKPLSEAEREHIESSFSMKLLGMDKEVKDDKLLWEILKKKRKHQALDSPVGPKELLGFDAVTDPHKFTGVSHQYTGHRPVTRSCTKGLSPQTPCSAARIPLGPSPSVPIRSVSGKRITPSRHA